MDLNNKDTVQSIFDTLASQLSPLPMVVSCPSVTLNEIGLDDSIFLDLVAKTSVFNEISKLDIIRWQSKLGILPLRELPNNPDDWYQGKPTQEEDEISKTLSRGAIDPKFFEKFVTYEEQITHLVNDGIEEEWQHVFPFRVRAEASLRRLRLADLPVICSNLGVELVPLLRMLSGCRSYIFIINIVLTHLTCSSFKFINWYYTRGALYSIKTFLSYSKINSTILKSIVYNSNYLMLVENNGMAGFRLLPDSSFDIVSATASSANGLGIEHSTVDGLAHKWGWINVVKILTVLPEPKLPIISFEEFVADPGLWTTSGSSSFGKVSIEMDRKWNFIKARKLMLPYCTTPEILINRCMAIRNVTSTSLVKSELAKIRVAVSSELEFYLIWAYLHHCYGDIYGKWNGVTLGENAFQECTRLYDMLLSLVDGFGFPADFEAFDSQPLTREVSLVGACLVNSAKMTRILPEWLITQSINGLLNSNLSTPLQPNGQRHTFLIKNYLPSGIFITSAVGNGFNCVASESMIVLVEQWTRRNRSLWLKNLELRGDDSSFITVHIGFLLLLALAAKVLKYKYANMKVAILKEGTEFLRVSISKEFGCRGYPARIIPALTQRKPWSNEPWDPEGVIRSHWDSCCALERRGQLGMILWPALEAVWSKKRKLPIHVISASSLDGGLGLGPMSRKSYFISPSLSKSLNITVNYKGSSWANLIYSKKLERLNLSVSIPNQVELVKKSFIGALSTADLPEYAALGQQAYKEHLTHIRIYERQRSRLLLRFEESVKNMFDIAMRITTPMELKNFSNLINPTWFGRYIKETEYFLERRRISQYESIVKDTAFDLDAATLARKMSCPTSTAEDWLLGTMPSTVFGCVHPSATSFLVNNTAALVEQSLGYGQVKTMGLGEVVRAVSWNIGIGFYLSQLHQKIYRW